MSSYYDDASLMLLASGGAQKDGKVYSIKPVPVYGTERVTNGTFNNDLSGWTINNANAGNVVEWSAGQAYLKRTASAATELRQSTLVVGKKYYVNVDVNIIGDSTGGALEYNGSTRFILNEGVNSFKFTASTTLFSFICLSNSTEYYIDNVSIKEVLVEDGDFTFSRGSNLAATRVDAAHLIEKGRENLLLQSNTFDNAVWDNQLGGSVTGGQTGYDGTLDAWLLTKSAIAYKYIRQMNLSASGVYNYSIYAKANTLNKITIFNDVSGANPYATFSLVDGSIVASSGLVDSSATDVGGGWWRLSATFNDTITTARIYPDFGQTTAGSIYIQDAQIEQGLIATDYIPTTTTTGTAGILEDTPRFDYSFGASCPSLLLEPSRLNNILYSENVTNSWWLKSNVTALDNQGISPEGLNNAGKITLTSTGGAVLYRTSLTIGNGVLSFFAKPGTLSAGRIRISVDGVGAAYWNLDGTINSVSGGTAEGAENYGNGWFRYSYNVPSGSVANYGVQGGVIGEGMLVYGMQVEPNATYTTSYIPTYGTSVTRAADTAIIRTLDTKNIITDSGSWTAFFELELLGNESPNDKIQLTDDSNNPRAYLYHQTAGVSPSWLGSSTLNMNTNNKIVYRGNSTQNISFFKNGNNAVTFSTTSTGLVFNRVNFYGANGAFRLKQAILFPTELSDLDCEILTGATTYNTFAEMAVALNYTVYE